MRPVVAFTVYAVVLPLVSLYVGAVVRKHGALSVSVPLLAVIVWTSVSIIVTIAVFRRQIKEAIGFAVFVFQMCRRPH